MSPANCLTDTRTFDRYADANPKVDGESLSIACQAFADWRVARAFIAKEGMTYVIRDKDGQIQNVKEFPQVNAARKAEALWIRLRKQLYLKTPKS